MTTATAQIDRKWIMNRAWHYVRISCRKPSPIELRFALRNAWLDMKAKMQGLRLVDELTAREKQLATLEAKSFTTPEQRNEMATLRTAIAQEHAASDLNSKRTIISAGQCEVTFIKADGSTRVMRVDPARLTRHVKGERATARGRRATATRKARHPHLMPVWDTEADAPRSVNLRTVQRITTLNASHTF